MTKTINYQNNSFSVFLNNDTEANFWERYSNSKWEPEVLDFYLSKKRGGTFLDIGSWIGPVSLLMSNYYEKVYSIDFDPIAKEHFKKNIELNNIKNIIPVSVGLFNKRGTIKLDPSWFGSSETSLFYNDEKGIEVELITFKDLIASIPERNNISFIKIDIEGGEFKILSDVYSFINRHSCITVISYHPFNLKKWAFSKWAWWNFRIRHAIRQLKYKKYIISSEGVKEVLPYNFGYLFKSKFQLADALES